MELHFSGQAWHAVGRERGGLLFTVWEIGVANVVA